MANSTNKQLHSQGKEIIARVYHRMKYEAENGVERLTDARWRTAQAVGYCESVITRVLREERLLSTPGSSSQSFSSPQKRKRKAPKTDLDDFSVVRRTIATFHLEHGQLVTLRKLQQVLKDNIGFESSLESLRTILRKAGFKWSKTDDNRRALVEKHEIQSLRYNYLKQLKKYREEGRYIVYTDETYVHTTHVQSKSWKSENQQSPMQKNLSKGTKIIIVHAGGCHGFVPNAFLMYKANSTSGDFHDNMKNENYTKWLTEKLLPNIPEKSVLVMYNASYHNTLSEKLPSSNWNKNMMQEWLTSKSITFDEGAKKIELYDLILQHKNRFKGFQIDEIVRSKGFEILRLPSYHPELNPIEKVWKVLKNYVAQSNVGQNLTSIFGLVNESIGQIDSNMWRATCEHVEEQEKEYMKMFDFDNPFIISIDDSDSEESSFSS